MSSLVTTGLLHAVPPTTWSFCTTCATNVAHAVWTHYGIRSISTTGYSLSPRPKTNPSVDRFQYRAWGRKFPAHYTGSDICAGWGLGTRLHRLVLKRIHPCKTSVSCTLLCIGCLACSLTSYSGQPLSLSQDPLPGTVLTSGVIPCW